MFAEQVGPEVTHFTCIRYILGSNLGWYTNYPEIVRGFLQSF
jgi:hypothetical protein